MVTANRKSMQYFIRGGGNYENSIIVIHILVENENECIKVGERKVAL